MQRRDRHVGAGVGVVDRVHLVAGDPSLPYEAKLEEYLEIADDYFETDKYWAFCAAHLGHLDAAVLDWVRSDAFDRLIVDTVRATYPPHEHDRFLGHFRGLTKAWADEQD